MNLVGLCPVDGCREININFLSLSYYTCDCPSGYQPFVYIIQTQSDIKEIILLEISTESQIGNTMYIC